MENEIHTIWRICMKFDRIHTEQWIYAVLRFPLFTTLHCDLFSTYYWKKYRNSNNTNFPNIFLSSVSLSLQNSSNFRIKMQFENGLNKWNGRVPPLDLSTVSVCPRETEQRWHEIVMPKPRKMFYERRRIIDCLPIGEYFTIFDDSAKSKTISVKNSIKFSNFDNPFLFKTHRKISIH